jgi:hypothetical protein
MFFRCNNAMEYCESTFLTIPKQNGTVPHHSCLSTSQCKHGQFLDTIKALLIYAFVPEHLWEEVALTVVYTIYRVSSRLPLLSISLLMNSCLALLMIISPSKSLVVSVLFLFNIMNAIN